MVRTIAETAVANEKYFGDLDAVVGDGDFGYSLARGFEIVLAEWDAFDRTDAGDVPAEDRRRHHRPHRRHVRTDLGHRVPAGRRAAVKGKRGVERRDVVAMLRAAVEGIKARGGADLGDKTLLDALVPATDKIERKLAAGERSRTIAAAGPRPARAAAEATTAMQARRGRAAYTGERSIGASTPARWRSPCWSSASPRTGRPHMNVARRPPGLV